MLFIFVNLFDAMAEITFNTNKTRTVPINRNSLFYDKDDPVATHAAALSQKRKKFLILYPADNEDSVLLTRRFLVYEDAMDIDGLGPNLVKALVEQGMVRSAADLYALDAESVAKLERMGQKSAENLIHAIESTYTYRNG